MKQLIKYDMLVTMDVEESGFESLSIHRKSQAPDHDKVWVLVVDAESDKHKRAPLRKRLDHLENGLKRFIKCDFILRTRQSLPYDLRQEFLAVDPPYILITEELSGDELQDRLVEVFDWPWVFGESKWIKAFERRLARDVLEAREALRKQFYRANCYLRIKDISETLSNPLETRLLASINLKRVDFIDESLTLLSDALKSNKTLKELKLLAVELLPWQAKKLGEALALNRCLIRLEISANPVKGAAQYFGHMLENNTALQSLSIKSNFLDINAALAFSNGLAKNKTLLHLDLSRCSLTDETIGALLPGLQKNSSLISIDLSFNEEIQQSTEALFASLFRAENPFAALNFSGNTLSTRPAILIANLLRNNYGLVSLKLWACHIPPRGIKAIFSALCSNQTLRELDLGLNKFPKKVLSYLIQAISQNTHLKRLGLQTDAEYDGSTAYEKIEAFFQALAQNCSLTSLDISISGFRDRGIIALIQYLQNNLFLRELKLSTFLWENNDEKKLAEALKHNHHIESLAYEDLMSKVNRKQIDQQLDRNREEHSARREEFIYNLISLNYSCDSWKILPLDIKLYIVSLLDLHLNADMGKNKEQIERCAHFLFTNFDECCAIIKAQKRILILERTDFKGRYQFRFFKPNEIGAKNTQSGDWKIITL